MKTTPLNDVPGFYENPVFERIISDLLDNKYSVIDGFFNRTQVAMLQNSLLAKRKQNKFKKAAIGNKTAEIITKKVRGDFIFWLNENQADPAENYFFSKINELTSYLNQTCFMGILQQEFHYAVYPKGTFYQRHLDVFKADDRRKLSFVCYLNDEEWSAENGGELVLYPSKKGMETVEKILPFPGRAVIFESQVLEHEVKPVLNAERLSITGWFKTR